MVKHFKTVSQKIDDVSAKIDRNQKALNQIDDIAKKIHRNQKALDQIDDIAKKIHRNQKALDQIDDVARILRENEQNLKDLGTLKSRLDLLDKIYITVDKIAGEVTTYRQQQELNSGKLANHGDRIEKIEKHLHFPLTP